MHLKYAEKFSMALFAMLVLHSAAVFAGPVDSWPAKPDRYVTDMANLIDVSAEQQLNGFLQELEQKAGVQFMVVTIESLEGETKEGFALAIAERWKIGTKGRDDGLIFLLAQKERAYRFETGYGLEGILPDGYLGEVGRERLVPYMKEGRASEGIALTVLTVLGKISQDKGITISGMPELRSMRSSSGGLGSLISIIIFFLVFSSLFGGARARSGHGLNRWRGGSMPFWAFFLGSMMGGGRGPRIGGGGGGFGSFGGGMGGGFGGGGAGGNW